jgi:serine/threonine protein kinase
MRPERFRQVEYLLQSALARDPEERPAFLTSACANDEELRREVESLLVSHQQPGGLLETPLSQVAAALLVRGKALCLDGQKIGRYEVLGQLGAGAMGEVYLARDTMLGRKVALKLLPAEFTNDLERVRRFEQEARAASALNHPNILTIHEIGQADGLHFIATEFIEGQTLRQRMAGGRMKLSETLDVAMQGAGALVAAHEAGIVHRDIKPENIMLRRDGYVKVLDFGLAKLTEGHPSIDARPSADGAFPTEPGTVMGTAHYMSPEQGRGLEVDSRTDVFSLGVVLYEMIAGRPPFEGATTGDVIAAILKEEPIPLEVRSPELPAELEWMVKKALAKDREQRYQTIRELHVDLKRLKQELELPAKVHGSIKRQQGHDVSRLKAVIVGLVAVSIFSLVSFYVGLRRAPSPATPTFRQLTYRRGAITRARFAPDGQTIIYSAAFDGKWLKLFALDPENPESSPINLQGGERVAGIQAISTTGEMAILLDCEQDWGNCTDGILARVDVSGGSPQEIVGLENVYDADWSPDGKDLAIVHGVEGEYQLEYPVGKVLYKAAGRILNMRVSPSGDKVAFIDQQSLSSWGGSIMLVDRDGKHQTLSAGWKSASGLAWSPAGDEVWFSGGRGGVLALHAVTTSGRERLVFEAPGNVHLHDISRTGRVLVHRGVPFSRMMVGFTAGSEKERDLSLLDWSTSADISADGKNLLFYEWGMAVGHDPAVYLRTMDGSKSPVRVGSGKALSLSPDGNWALALHETPFQQLILLPTGVGEPILLPRGEITEYSYASWFPDGRRILFTGLVPGHALRSYSQETPLGEPKAVTEEGIVALSVLPDGKRFLAWAPDKGLLGTYYLGSIDETKSARYASIEGLDLGDIPIRFSADANFLYVRSPGGFGTRIIRVDLSSGHRDVLKEIVPDPVGFVGLEEKPGGIQITPDGKLYVYTYWTVLRDLFLVEGLK